MHSPTGPNFPGTYAPASFPTVPSSGAAQTPSAAGQLLDTSGNPREVTYIERVIPKERFYDPVTNNLMADPVRCYPCGHVFERRTAMQDIARNVHHKTCPLLSCKQEVTHTAPHTILKNMIRDWKTYNEPLHPPEKFASNKRKAIEIEEGDYSPGRITDPNGRQVGSRLEYTEPARDAHFTPVTYFPPTPPPATAVSSSSSPPSASSWQRLPMNFQFPAPLPTGSGPGSENPVAIVIRFAPDRNIASSMRISGAPERSSNAVPSSEPRVTTSSPATPSSGNLTVASLLGITPHEATTLPSHVLLDKIANAVKAVNERGLMGEKEGSILTRLNSLANWAIQKQMTRMPPPASAFVTDGSQRVPAPPQLQASQMPAPMQNRTPSGRVCPVHQVDHMENQRIQTPRYYTVPTVPPGNPEGPQSNSARLPTSGRPATPAAHFPITPPSFTSVPYPYPVMAPNTAPQQIRTNLSAPAGHLTEAQQSALMRQLEEQRKQFQTEQNELRKKMEEQEAVHRNQTEELQGTLRKQQEQLLKMQRAILQQQQRLRVSAERSPGQPHTPESPLIMFTPPIDGGFEAANSIPSAAFYASPSRISAPPMLETASSAAAAPTIKNPLHVAAESISRLGFQAIIPLLRAYDINSLDENGNTPLHYAVKAGRAPQFIQSLLKNGANPNLKNANGETPLHVATKLKRYSIVRRILNHFNSSGSRVANPTLKDNDGKTALENAPSLKMRRIFQSAMSAAAPEVVDNDDEAIEDDGIEDDEDSENNETAGFPVI